MLKTLTATQDFSSRLKRVPTNLNINTQAVFSVPLADVCPWRFYIMWFPMSFLQTRCHFHWLCEFFYYELVAKVYKCCIVLQTMRSKVIEVAGGTKLKINDDEHGIVGWWSIHLEGSNFILLTISMDTKNIGRVRHYQTRGSSQRSKQVKFLGAHLQYKAPPKYTGGYSNCHWYFSRK